MLKFIKDIIATKKCYSCGQEWHFLCPRCMSKMSNFSSICYVCKAKSDYFEVHQSCLEWIYFDKLIILTHYKQNIIKKLIKDFKFYYKKDIADDFWKYLWDLLLKNISWNLDDFLLIPIPLYFLKKWKRWYNQTELLIKIISKNTSIKFKNNLIKRIKNTRQQSQLSRQERLSNLESAFKINKKQLDKVDKNKTIIIVDDVVSTWTSINSVAKLLKQNWFKKVIWLVIASD